MSDVVSRPPGFAAEGILAIGARIGAAVSAHSQLTSEERKSRLFAEMYQTPIVLPNLVITTSAGVLIPTDQAGPMTGQYWSVRRLVASGYSAGTVTVYRNATVTAQGASAAVVGEILFTFPQAGTYTFGRGEMELAPDDFLVILATGVTLNTGAPGIQITGTADVYSAWLRPEYLV